MRVAAQTSRIIATSVREEAGTSTLPPRRMMRTGSFRSNGMLFRVPALFLPLAKRSSAPDVRSRSE